jgi:poly(A) polymerase
MAMFERGPGPWLRPIKEHLLGLVIDGVLTPDNKEEAGRIARELMESGRAGDSSILFK